MKAFLEEIAEELSQLKTDEIQNTIIIVPNRRANIYLKHYLAKKINKPIWTPEIFSINDFIYKHTGLQEANHMELMVKLYQAHQKIEKKNPQSIDQFGSWAELLINDFNEIDLYLAPAKNLFSYLSDAKTIASWDLEISQLTSQEKNYLKFYESLATYYSEFKNTLLSENKAYQGMAYRMLAENPEHINYHDKKIYIIGFNALSPSEKEIIKHLETTLCAKTYWDIDKYYFDNINQEAGVFLRKQLENKERKHIKNIYNYWKETKKNINIYGINGNISQVKLASEIIHKQLLHNPDSLEDTALILGNEDLMIPVINSIPKEVNKFNLTMSFPLKLHSSYELINSVFKITSSYFEKNEENKSLKIYHKFFFSFLNHPFIQKYLNQDLNIINNIHKLIKRENISQIHPDEKFLSQFDDSEKRLTKLFSIIKKVNNNPICLLDIIIQLFELLESIEVSEFDINFYKHYINIISDLKSTMNQLGNIEKLNTVKQWLQNAISQSPIPFSGEPLEGLQIMGMLETRTLDFKNIILLSTNEGSLPKTKAYQSFILYDIKKQFGLPLPIENDAITAYHFYRLLQRAENISLIYTTKTGDMQSCEASRFIKQIELEIPSVNPKININHHQVELGFQAEDNVKKIEIQKTEAILNKLKTFASTNGFSPSTLNNYKKCSYYFYLQKILGIKTDIEVEENMAYNTQGNIIHETLEEFYKQFINSQINIIDFDSKKESINNLFKHKIDKHYGEGNTDTGRNYLTKKVLEKYIENFIKKEKTFLKSESCKLIDVEKELIKNVTIYLNNDKTTVKFKGSADRIDQIGSKIRIVDYKTGSVNKNDLNIKIHKGFDQWKNMFNDKYDKAFQLMMYAWLYHDEKPDNFELESGIVALKNHSEYFPVSLYGETNITDEYITQFEEDLTLLIQDIFNPDILFFQRENDQICKNCDYNTICNRS